MNLDNLIGYPIDYVKKVLEENNFKYEIAESSDIQKKYDTVLVTKITKNGDIIRVVTDKFLLYI